MHIVCIKLRLLLIIIRKQIVELPRFSMFRYFFHYFQVCLDNIVTTEKELDTVEVLKAIQKAKEVKYKLSNSDKKVSLVLRGVECAAL